ncbi:YgfZ/GcvT domain-containing protein [Frateuria defendens]|uniref:CAF17-like 4Fe-4S cluster assembly/insertion protein YgfZ n=1 Tax=Frateuria defendens TaxID=2219559 RepID=UPI00066FEFD9|nr:folate-binding protein [Frateuria defendens]
MNQAPPASPIDALPAQTLLLSGPDAGAFAQAQFSSNLSTLDVGHWQFSAWLDAQGRVRALFQLARLREDAWLLLLRGGAANALADALRSYVLRAKLRIDALPASTLSTGAALPLHTLAGDEHRLTLGCGDHSLQVGAGDADGQWRLWQIRHGWPWLPDEALDALLPPALSLAQLQATALDKGCYPGQEIVARLHYRGGNKRHMHGVLLSHPLRAGTVVRDDGRETLRLLDVAPADGHWEALAVIADDALQSATDNVFATAEGVAITLGTKWPA